MILPIFTSFLIFVALIRLAIRRGDDRKKAEDAEFFRREQEANFVRKKSLDDLDYIRIPVDDLPFGAPAGNAAAQSAQDTIRRLSGEKIVNLTGISNTDLKLAYGTANITPLTQYDVNYMELARSLQKWGKELFAERMYPEAAQVLRFAIDTRTDISQSWHLYIDCVRMHLGLTEEESRALLMPLIPVAKSLQALSRDSILQELTEACSDPK